MNVSNDTLICVECRVARKGYSASCGVEGHKMISVGKRFRAPKKRDKKAWKRIAEGDRLTEFSQVELREFRTNEGYYAKVGKGKKYKFFHYYWLNGTRKNHPIWLKGK